MENKADLTRLSFANQADMAPRKRTTKQPKNETRALKLEAFLRDFDSESKFSFVLIPLV